MKLKVNLLTGDIVKYHIPANGICDFIPITVIHAVTGVTIYLLSGKVPGGITWLKHICKINS
jgi:hypothetical protein